jgi:hypothetical protein
MTAAPLPWTPSVREGLLIAARGIEPILNRVVLVGPPVVELLTTDPAVRVPRLSFAADAVFQFLSTSMLDRLGAELQKLGGTRISHSANTDRWRTPTDVLLDVIQVRPEDGDPAQLWLEYATLVTLPLALDGQLTVRIAGAAAMLALECGSFEIGGGRAVDSDALERVVLLIAGRSEIEKECAGAPPELRSFVASTLGKLAEADAVQILIQRALPDAIRLPALAKRVRDRIERMAGSWSDPLRTAG